MSEIKETTSVVTSENLAEFQAQKLGLATQEPEAVAAEEAEPVAEQEESSEPVEAEKEATDTEKKQNPKLEKRFSELTKQREIARQEAAREREAREALEARLRALEQQANPQQAREANEKPTPAQFSDAFEYAEALAEWSAEQAIVNLKKEESEKQAQAEREKVIKSWNAKLEAAKAELPDYEDMVASSDVVVGDHIRDAILESDVGPKILYHLAENPEIAEKLSSLSTASALREIGKLEARFEKVETPAAKAVSVSKAPAPIAPLKAKGSALDVNVDSKGEFHGTFQAWKAARLAGRIR
jgi:hypothetical protein